MPRTRSARQGLGRKHADERHGLPGPQWVGLGGYLHHQRTAVGNIDNARLDQAIGGSLPATGEYATVQQKRLPDHCTLPGAVGVEDDVGAVRQGDDGVLGDQARTTRLLLGRAAQQCRPHHERCQDLTTQWVPPGGSLRPRERLRNGKAGPGPQPPNGRGSLAGCGRDTRFSSRSPNGP